MLDTNLKHITTDEEFKSVIEENENVMICCGRMGPMCLPVYDVMENFESRYPDVTFRDMAFDEPVGHNIRDLEEVQSFMGLPFTVYFKNGKVVEATSSVQNKAQVAEIIKNKFGK
ncbi:MAG: thioredoxin [Deltaproteobacteria bacterium]|nr:thioredoxin [Deltaproteobacteria bacterium]